MEIQCSKWQDTEYRSMEKSNKRNFIVDLIARFITFCKPMEIQEIHQSISMKGLISKSDSTLQMLIRKREAPSKWKLLTPSRFRSVRPKS